MFRIAKETCITAAQPSPELKNILLLFPINIDWGQCIYQMYDYALISPTGLWVLWEYALDNKYLFLTGWMDG